IVILSNNLKHSIFAFIATFTGISGIYIFLIADFLAIVQILLNVVAFSILIIIGVIITNKVPDFKIPKPVKQKYLYAGFSLLFFILLLIFIFSTPWKTGKSELTNYTIKAIGESIITTYLMPLEIVSIFLLSALVGTAYLIRKR
ncbi:MAG: NADH-quinone oxidoreductase subunit J, partial [Candidatus Marinimicrobia bacterium]|nr:NADH-quinone oxidoreductase subunit J [Candidatus Neomarinimicrobiota bacterium]